MLRLQLLHLACLVLSFLIWTALAILVLKAFHLHDRNGDFYLPFIVAAVISAYLMRFLLLKKLRGKLR
jgi:hypothetical protein